MCKYSWYIPFDDMCELFFWCYANSTEEAVQNILKQIDDSNINNKTHDYSRNTLINYFDLNNKQYTIQDYILNIKPNIYYNEYNDDSDSDTNYDTNYDNDNDLNHMSESEHSHYDDY
jgi:hypothetical protein